MQDGKGCMPPIPYHHLYNIHILVIISRHVVDVFGSRFLSPSCLPFAFFYPHYLTILLSLLLALEMGCRLRCRGQAARVLRVSCFSFPHIYFVFYLYDLIPRSMLHPPPFLPHPPTYADTSPRALFEFSPISCSCMISLPVELIRALVHFLRFASVIPILNDHVASLIETPLAVSSTSIIPYESLGNPIIFPVLVCVSCLLFRVRALIDWGSLLFCFFWIVYTVPGLLRLCNPWHSHQGSDWDINLRRWAASLSRSGRTR